MRENLLKNHHISLVVSFFFTIFATYTNNTNIMKTNKLRMFLMGMMACLTATTAWADITID
jgi:hypothetical protein